MKKILLAFFFLSYLNGLYAQDDLCFTKTTRSYIKIGDVNLSDLTTSEKLSTRQRNSVIREREYLDADREYVRTYRYVYEKNFFPDWYVKPDEVLINQYGRYNFFYSTSTIYEGGWEGWQNNGATYGQYQDGYRGFPNRRNYYIPNDTRMQQEYEEVRDIMRVKTVQWFKRFIVPTQDVLNQYIIEGYSVNVDQGVITMQGFGVTRIIDTVKKMDTFISEDTNGNTVTSVTTYKYFEEVDDILMHTVTTTTPIILSTGDCAIEVHEEEYNEYSNNCAENDSPFIGGRSRIEVDKDIKLYPNPALDEISLTLPDALNIEDVYVTIYSNMGFVVSEFKASSNKVVIDVNNFSSGMYQCVIRAKENYFIKSFVKQ